MSNENAKRMQALLNEEAEEAFAVTKRRSEKVGRMLGSMNPMKYNFNRQVRHIAEAKAAAEQAAAEKAAAERAVVNKAAANRAAANRATRRAERGPRMKFRFSEEDVGASNGQRAPLANTSRTFGDGKAAFSKGTLYNTYRAENYGIYDIRYGQYGPDNVDPSSVLGLWTHDRNENIARAEASAESKAEGKRGDPLAGTRYRQSVLAKLGPNELARPRRQGRRSKKNVR